MNGGRKNSIFGLKKAAVSCKINRTGHVLSRKEVRKMEFFLLAGGLLIIIFAVVISVVSSVVSAIAAEQDDASEQ